MTTPQAQPSVTVNPQQLQKYDNYPGYPDYANHMIRLAIGRLDHNTPSQLESIGLNWSLLGSKDPMYAHVSNQRRAVERVLQYVNPLVFGPNSLVEFFSKFEEAMGDILDMMLPRPLATPSPQPYPPGPSILPYINPNASGSRRQASRYYKSKSI